MSRPTFSLSSLFRNQRFHCSASLVGLAFLAACAAPVPSTAVRLERPPSTTAVAEIMMQREVGFRLSTGYTRTLPAMSRWRHVGRVAQGEVYRPVDLAFALEGRHVHEAYLVLDGRTLRGFYLPGESAYSALDPVIPLPIGELK
jgi:hypothetical protein